MDEDTSLGYDQTRDINLPNEVTPEQVAAACVALGLPVKGLRTLKIDYSGEEGPKGLRVTYKHGSGLSMGRLDLSLGLRRRDGTWVY